MSAEYFKIGADIGLGALEVFTGADDQDKAIKAATHMQVAEHDFQAAEKERDRYHDAVEAERQRNFERAKEQRRLLYRQAFVNRQRQADIDFEKWRGSQLRENQDFRARHGIAGGEQGYDTAGIKASDDLITDKEKRKNDPIMASVEDYPDLQIPEKSVPPIGEKPPKHKSYEERRQEKVDELIDKGVLHGPDGPGTGLRDGGQTGPDPGMGGGTAAALTVPPEVLVNPPGGPAGSRYRIPAGAHGGGPVAAPPLMKPGSPAPEPWMIPEGASPGYTGPAMNLPDPAKSPYVIIN